MKRAIIAAFAGAVFVLASTLSLAVMPDGGGGEKDIREKTQKIERAEKASKADRGNQAITRSNFDEKIVLSKEKPSQASEFKDFKNKGNIDGGKVQIGRPSRNLYGNENWTPGF